MLEVARKVPLKKQNWPSVSNRALQVEQLPQLSHRLLRASHTVTNSARVLENLVVVAALVSLVAEEVDLAVLDASDLLLGLDVLQAVGLVPAGREDVKGDLSADRVAVELLASLISSLFLRVSHSTYVSPKSGNCSLIACTNFSRILCSRSNFSYSLRSCTVAFLPIGLTLIMPFLNSTNVPRLTGMSRSAT